MPRVLSLRNISLISETFIWIMSAVVFFLLDFLDTIMCVFFRFVDGFLEGESSPCYCVKREAIENQERGKKEEFLEVERGNELSESLHGRRNIFREMGFLRRKRNGFSVGKGNRWSDCGCESCLSWMSHGNSEFKLHVVVKELLQDRQELCSQERSVHNVIFIHGFLSSSSFWTQTVLPNLCGQTAFDYKFFAVDLLGFGRSPKPRNCSYTVKDHLEMLEASVIRPFELSSFHLVAHSMGCVIALALAAKHSDSVKSITLIAPPYFSSSQEDASSAALERLAMRRAWPPLLFASALMSWYEHVGRCVCFLICRNHKTWEWILKKLCRTRDLHFSVIDMTRHTHHSAWHTMHNVICGGVKLLDEYLEILTAARVKIRVVQGMKDRIVPPECGYNMKMKAPEIELDIITNSDHNNVIFGREKEFVRNLESLWESSGKITAEEHIDMRFSQEIHQCE